MLQNLHLAQSEMSLLVFMCLVLLLAAVKHQSNPAFVNKMSYYLSLIALVVSAIFTFHDYSGSVQLAFGDLFVSDKLSLVLKQFIYLTVFLCLVYGRIYLEEKALPQAEYYVLALASTLGMMVMVSSENMLTLYLGLELMSLPIYAMVALQRNKWKCLEAGMKYFIMGALASGLLLYGISLLYGATQTLSLDKIAIAIAHMPSQQSMVLIIGLVFVLAGVIFKFGAAPFHLWVPDIYEGAPASVTLFISAAPKLAIFGLAVRLMHHALGGLHIEWQNILIVVSVLSMSIGNFVAVIQTNLKRMLAYSSIAHIGYMVLGLLTNTINGYASSLFYIISYSLMSVAAFGMLTFMSRGGYDVENISDLAGLNHRAPWLAFIMLLIMFSMAGIPPLVGFMAKLGVLEALVAAHMVWLAVLALLFAIVGAYYYINVVKVMYFEQPKATEVIVCPQAIMLAVTVNGIGVLLLGVFPSALFGVCHGVF